MMKTKIDRNKEISGKLDAMWNDLSEKARDVIATTDMDTGRHKRIYVHNTLGYALKRYDAALA